MMKLYNEDEIRRTIKVMKPDNELFEVRIINKKRNYSGYFTDAEVVIKELNKLNSSDLIGSQIYFTLNRLNDGCYAKEQHDRFIYGASSTSDNEITDYEWLLIDFDPVRLSGISSTEKELNYACGIRDEVYEFLKSNGFGEPLTALSGNGWHLLYKVNFPNTKENRNIVKNFLDYLNFRFSDSGVEVDKAVFNPARITKLYGTVAQKGMDTVERPHRMSLLMELSTPTLTELSKVILVSNMLPPKEVYIPNNNSKFNLEDFIRKHNIQVRDEVHGSDVTKYILESCPFNSEHDKDKPAIFQLGNGAIAYKCFHNSCSNNGWKEFRNYYEPNYESNYTKLNYQERTIGKASQERQNMKNYYDIAEIKLPDAHNVERVRSGINELDYMVGGFTYDCVTLWASQTNGGKTTLLTMLTNNFINQGKRLFYFNGEQTKENFKNNLFIQGANKEQIEIINNDGILDSYVSDEESERLSKIYNGKLYIYNNNAPKDADSLIRTMFECRTKGIKDFIIDNLMQIETNGNDIFREQERLAEKLRTFALNTHSNVHLVAHSRKTNGNNIRLTLFDVAGSQTIANKSYNIITIIRIDQLDSTSNEYDRLKNELLKEGYNIYSVDGVLEVLKYKYPFGRTGLVGLKYNKDKRTYEEVKKRSVEEIEIEWAMKEQYESREIKKNKRNKRHNPFDD